MVFIKKHFGRKFNLTVFIFYFLLLSGCDQVKNRLFNPTKNIPKYEDDAENDKNLKTEKVDERLLNSPEQKPLPILKQFDKNNDIQFELIMENSKKTINEKPYSIIGIEGGKPFREDSTEKIKSD